MEPLPPAMKLLFSLPFLATGEPHLSLPFGYRLVFSNVSEILGTVQMKISEILVSNVCHCLVIKSNDKKFLMIFGKSGMFQTTLGQLMANIAKLSVPPSLEVLQLQREI